MRNPHSSRDRRYDTIKNALATDFTSERLKSVVIGFLRGPVGKAQTQVGGSASNATGLLTSVVASGVARLLQEARAAGVGSPNATNAETGAALMTTVDRVVGAISFAEATMTQVAAVMDGDPVSNIVQVPPRAWRYAFPYARPHATCAFFECAARVSVCVPILRAILCARLVDVSHAPRASICHRTRTRVLRFQNACGALRSCLWAWRGPTGTRIAARSCPPRARTRRG